MLYSVTPTWEAMLEIVKRAPSVAAGMTIGHIAAT